MLICVLDQASIQIPISTICSHPASTEVFQCPQLTPATRMKNAKKTLLPLLWARFPPNSRLWPPSVWLETVESSTDPSKPTDQHGNHAKSTYAMADSSDPTTAMLQLCSIPTLLAAGALETPLLNHKAVQTTQEFVMFHYTAAHLPFSKIPLWLLPCLPPCSTSTEHLDECNANMITYHLKHLLN